MPQRVLEEFWESSCFRSFPGESDALLPHLSPQMATLNLLLKFGKKIYKTKPALSNNPSHPLLALPHECKFSQWNRLVTQRTILPTASPRFQATGGKNSSFLSSGARFVPLGGGGGLFFWRGGRVFDTPWLALRPGAWR